MHEITIPRLGWSMEEGTFVRWLKQDGDRVSPGDPLFELEGEKSAQDIEAVDGGILRYLPSGPTPGNVVAVGTVIGYLAAEGESIPATHGDKPRAAAGSIEPVANPGVANRPDTELIPPAAAPSVRRRARELGVSLAEVRGSGPAGRIESCDLSTVSNRAVREDEESGHTVASPRARRVARELGINWKRLTGTGRDGRVRECDVIQAANHSRFQPVVEHVAGQGTGRMIALTSHRKTIAERMRVSHHTTVPVTLTTTVDATNLVNLRKQFQSAGDGSQDVPSYTDVVIRLVALVLPDHPLLMAQWSDRHLIVPEVISIGVAVDTEGGLLVPVVANVPALSLPQLTHTTRDLIARARAGKLKAPDMQGGVFTVTNLGALGIDAFTPVINPPEAAILGLGRIRREPVVKDQQIVPGDRMTLSLTFDHRIVDGAPAARFLQTLGQALESPSAWLLRAQ